MQADQTKKQINKSPLLQIQNHWAILEQAFRIEEKERQQDLQLLKEQLQERDCRQRSIDNRKGQILGQTLSGLNRSAQESKQNAEKLFEREAEFRINHLEQKNLFIQKYLKDGNSFNSTLQQYATDNINDVDAKLQSIDAAKSAQTNQILKQIKEEVLADALNCFSKEKQKYMHLFSKISSDTHNSMHELRAKLKAKKKQREETVVKLRLMVNSLVGQLASLCETQSKQCEITYDSLLKLMEQCCGKIGKAQLQ